jgi:methyltransferase (TIGR00027 family)
LEPRRSSFSAEVVALARALESSGAEGGKLFEDPLARSFLSPRLSALLHLLRLPVLGAVLLGIADRITPGARGFPVARTRYIDDALIADLGNGLDQVAILGAGFDSRAYRIAGIEQTRVFEVDHPDTQARKRECLGRVLGEMPTHVRFVPIDFDGEALGEAMSASGFRRDRRTFFILEGVTEYLSDRTADMIFRYIAGAAKRGSKVAFTYIDRGALDGTRQFPGSRALLAHNLRGREPFTFGFDPSELGGYLADRGLELIEDVAGAEFEARYFGPERRRLRSTDFQRTVLARILGSSARADLSEGAG